MQRLGPDPRLGAGPGARAPSSGDASGMLVEGARRRRVDTVFARPSAAHGAATPRATRPSPPRQLIEIGVLATQIDRVRRPPCAPVQAVAAGPR